MSSEMFVFDDTNYYQDDISRSTNNFFTDPLSTISDSSIDSLLQEITSTHEKQQSFDQFTHALFTDSPPSNQLNTLSLEQQSQGQFGHYSFNNYCVVPEVKSEEFQLGFEYNSQNTYINNSNCNKGSGENMMKFMQRSYSSNCFQGNSKPGFLLQPRFDALLEGENFNLDDGNSQMRRVCSTGDLPEVGMKQQACTQQTICSSSSLSGESSNFNEEANFKVGRYSAEERKERIDRYKAKRTQRNFNKTIKYACRKTLADNRPRIRGRFARNDETGEIPKPTSFEDDDHLWVDNLHEDEQVLSRGPGRFVSNFGATQFQYCGY